MCVCVAGGSVGWSGAGIGGLKREMEGETDSNPLDLKPSGFAHVLLLLLDLMWSLNPIELQGIVVRPHSTPPLPRLSAPAVSTSTLRRFCARSSSRLSLFSASSTAARNRISLNA